MVVAPFMGGHSFLWLVAIIIFIIPYRSEIVEIFDFGAVFLLSGHTGKGSKMSYDVVSSSMDYSNRMTGLMGYAPRRCSATTCGKELEEP
jgi:hypothetical protein